MPKRLILSEKNSAFVRRSQILSEDQKTTAFRSWFFILIIIFLATVLRFWNLERLTTFGGDQGYDFAMTRQMFTESKPTLLGPKIGPYNKIGNLYLGPAYYYLLVPSLYLAKFDPIGPATLTVIFSLVTIFIIYLTANRFLSYPVAVVSCAVYAFSSFLITQSKSPSNPHLIPMFASILLFSSLQMTSEKSKKLIWAFVAGISTGIIFQLHYLGASLLVSSLVFLLFNKKVKESLMLIMGFIVGISPQIVFELRHDFFVTNIFIRQLKYGNNVSSFGDVFNNLLVSSKQISLIFLQNNLGLVLTLISFLILLSCRKKVRSNILMILSLNLVANLLFASFYSGNIGPHYFSSIYPSVSILFGTAIVFAYQAANNFFVKLLVVSASILILFFNLSNLNLYKAQGFTMPKGQNLTGIRKIAKIIAADVTPTTRFNIASVLDGDTRSMPYRYLVDVYGKTALDVEKYPESEIIYLVSRDEEEAIRRYTVWEIASFAPFDISDKWEIQNGIHLYKLTKAQKI